MTMQMHTNRQANMKDLINRAAARISSAPDLEGRREDRRRLGQVMIDNVWSALPAERLAWLLRGQEVYIDSVSQEKGEQREKAWEELSKLTGERHILSALPQNAVASYVTPARDAILAHAKDSSFEEALAVAKDLTFHWSVLTSMPDRDKLAYIVPVRDKMIELAQRYDDPKKIGHAFAGDLYGVFTDGAVISNLPQEARIQYVSDGISRLVDISQKREEWSDGRVNPWKKMVDGLVDSHQIAPFTSEEVLQKAGYLTLNVETNEELQSQLGVMLDFLSGQNEVTRAKYAIMVKEKIISIEEAFGDTKADIALIKDPNMRSNYALLQETLKHERLAGSVPA